jgi:hypothetical protein
LDDIIAICSCALFNSFASQDVGIGQDAERKAAEKLMQNCPLTEWGPELDILAEKKKV